MAARLPIGEAGFTLIELMISLALFGLIAVAGLAMVDGLLGIQSRTDGRLTRLADMQRAMFVLTSDLDQIADGPVTGDGATLAFRRTAPLIGGAAVPVRYGVVAGMFGREVGGLPQRLLGGVAALRWRFYERGAGWIDRWPPDPTRAKEWPVAIAGEMVVAGGLPGPSGTLRRVVLLPARP